MNRREIRRRVDQWQLSLQGCGDLPRSIICAMRKLRGMDACEASLFPLDNQLKTLLQRDDALGIVYPIIQEPALKRAYAATAEQRRRFSDDEIPAVTQLFTPDWIVHFLLRDTLGKWWQQHRASRQVRDIRLLDPACGSMNFGVAAIDFLRDLYRQELRQSDRPSVRSEDQIDQSIVTHNLFGWDIDPVSLQLAHAAIELKTRRSWRRDELNLQQRDALLEPCDQRFDVIVTNPPYLSARNMPAAMLAKIKKRYPAGARDLYACFLLRAMELLCPQGRAGLLVMQSFMFTPMFAKLRRQLLDSAAVESILHIGAGAFDVGNAGTLQTVAITMRNEPAPEARNCQQVTAVRLTDCQDKPQQLEIAIKARRSSRVFHLLQSELAGAIRGNWCYWLTGRAREVFETFPRLHRIAEPKQGLATTDNGRFVRWWWELSPTNVDAPLKTEPDKWFPYAKSGRRRSWFESPMHRVNWQNDGEQIKAAIVERYPYLHGKWQWVAKNSQWYFRRGVTYSYLTSGQFSARLLEAGAVFDVAGSCLFPQDELSLLAVLNSSAARKLLGMINPTVNFQVGDLAELPVPAKVPESVRQAVERAIAITRLFDQHDPASPDFVSPWPWNDQAPAGLLKELTNLEQFIDRSVAELYSLKTTCNSEPSISLADRAELARQWVWHALRELLRQADPTRPLVLNDALCYRLRDLLAQLACTAQSSTNIVDEILEQTGPLSRYLSGGLLRWQEQRFRDRPMVWVIKSKDVAILLPHDWADDAMKKRVSRLTGVQWRDEETSLDVGIEPRLPA